MPPDAINRSAVRVLDAHGIGRNRSLSAGALRSRDRTMLVREPV